MTVWAPHVPATDDPAFLYTATRDMLWAAFAATRGLEPVRRRGFVAVDGPPGGRRWVLMLTPGPGPGDLAELAALVGGGGRILVEDPFGATDMAALGLTPEQLPLMIRRGGPLPPPAGPRVVRVGDDAELRAAERVIVCGFPLRDYLPYRPGRLLPPALLARGGIDVFLAELDGVPVGAGIAAGDGAASGVYWVTTLPEYRSRGVGRAIMRAILRHRDGAPVVLTSSPEGQPLYESLGFAVAGQAVWWKN